MGLDAQALWDRKYRHCGTRRTDIVAEEEQVCCMGCLGIDGMGRIGVLWTEVQPLWDWNRQRRIEGLKVHTNT